MLRLRACGCWVRCWGWVSCCGVKKAGAVLGGNRVFCAGGARQEGIAVVMGIEEPSLLKTQLKAKKMALTSPSDLNDLELGVDETPSSRPDDDNPRFNPPDAIIPDGGNGNDDYDVNGTTSSFSFSSSSPSSSRPDDNNPKGGDGFDTFLSSLSDGGPPPRLDVANDDSTPPNHENDATPICPLCLDEHLTSTAAVVLSACQHQSCRACLVGWIREQSPGRNTGPSCPFCRVAICEEDVVRILGILGRPLKITRFAFVLDHSEVRRMVSAMAGASSQRPLTRLSPDP
jgi:hypothetical protein